MRLLNAPIRRLEGITYWVIEDAQAIHDFINTNIRKEWEQDARSEQRNPRDDKWLQTLHNRKWELAIAPTTIITLNPTIMNYSDERSGYVFAARLKERAKELQRVLELYGSPIWPLVVRGADSQLVDGYCRYLALKSIGVSRVYVYEEVV